MLKSQRDTEEKFDEDEDAEDQEPKVNKTLFIYPELEGDYEDF